MIKIYQALFDSSTHLLFQSSCWETQIKLSGQIGLIQNCIMVIKGFHDFRVASLNKGTLCESKAKIDTHVEF